MNDAAKASTQPNNADRSERAGTQKDSGTKKDESASQRADAPERAKPDGQDQNVQPPETSDQQSTGETKEISEEEKIPDSLQEPKYQTRMTRRKNVRRDRRQTGM